MRLLSFEAIATGTMFRITIAGVPYVNFTECTKIPRAVVLTFGYSAADAAVYFMLVFIHHIKKPPFIVKAVCANCKKIIDIFKKMLYNSVKE